jgi:hypothetical protein
LLVGVLLGTGAAFRTLTPEPAAWQLLLAQASAGGLFYAAFVLLGPFTAMREVVSETLDDLLPARAAQVVRRLGRFKPQGTSRSSGQG